MKRIFWFYGLSGSGKSTAAKLFYRLLRPYKDLIVLLDADKLRSDLWPELSIDKEGRVENVKRITRLARMYYDEGFTVVIAASAPFEEQRAFVKHLFPSAFFYMLDTDLQTCQSRKPWAYGESNLYKVECLDASPGPDEVINGRGDLEGLVKQIQDQIAKIN